jgi:hypothetical protein
MVLDTNAMRAKKEEGGEVKIMGDAGRRGRWRKGNNEQEKH